MLRKFFKSNFRVKNHEQNDLFVERLLGHDGYLNGTYWKKSLKELSDFYKQGMDTVTVFDRKEDSWEENQKLRQEIEELKRQREKDKELLMKNVAEWVDVFLKDAIEAGKFLPKTK